MSRFLNNPITTDLDNTLVQLEADLAYESDLLCCTVTVPKGFICDLESVPRIPLIYAYLGHTSKRAGILHDYLYRIGAAPDVTRGEADAVYREASESQGNTWLQSYLKWLGVRIGGGPCFKKKAVL
jgi:hypothetical protein